jgi:hypothetical protein
MHTFSISRRGPRAARPRYASPPWRRAIAAIVLLGGLSAIALVHAPAAHGSTPIAFTPCPSFPGLPDAGQLCGTVSVPLDYKNPAGQRLNIAVSKIPAANPAKRRGVLLVNPGGPGGPGVNIPRLLTTLWPQSVLDTYDLIGFDPRGVGTSAPVTCGLTADQALQAFPTLTQSNSFIATVIWA